MARPTTAARRYAEAAFELADRDGALDAWADGLDAAAAAVADDQVATFLDNPAVPLKDRLAAVERVLHGRPDGVVRLAKVLAQRRAAARLGPIASEYHRLLNRRRGIVEALVTSASPLAADDVAAVRHKVEQMTSASVELRTAVDTELIGGLTVRIGDTLYDASVRGRLERLREQLLATAR
ncbi:MAG TPA: F0F1 ATP synthase subunit delta [Candidatus Limnocylindrales bacterium]|nr:F0F1 ATP synthase subunit delta [Candidatus Limnocylindrales bacterium]